MTNLTPETLAELRRLLDEATPGPWGLTYARNERTRLWSDADGHEQDIIALDPTCERGQPCPDMRLIAAAVNALPSLLDQLDAAEASLARVRERRDHQTEPVVRTVGDLTARHRGKRVRITDPADGDSEGELVGFDVDPECISVWLHMHATIECTPDTPCEVLP